MCFAEKKVETFRCNHLIPRGAGGGGGLITPNRIGRRQSDFPHPTIIYTEGAVGIHCAPFETHQGSLVISFTQSPSCATVNRDVVVML